MRWTIGNLRERGFELLRLSIHCAFRLFGAQTRYLVCVNSLSLEEAQNKTGPVPPALEWWQSTRADLPHQLRQCCDAELMQGTGWKLSPLRVDMDRYELALDNDCILWDFPEGVRQWLASENGSLFAEDVVRCLGRFDPICPPGALNSGIRGLPPGKDLGPDLEAVLHESARDGESVKLATELDEQGLQAAAICRAQPLFLVKTGEVSICSPFWPRSPDLGTCGAHFVGMNALHCPWNYFDQPADTWLESHWLRHRPALYRKAGLELPE